MVWGEGGSSMDLVHCNDYVKIVNCIRFLF